MTAQAKQDRCFFEINSSPDRLDLSAEKFSPRCGGWHQIAVSTDAHSTREFELIRYGIDQARRAGLDKSFILNCLSWQKLGELIERK